MRRLPALLAVLLLTVAACGDDGSSSAVGDAGDAPADEADGGEAAAPLPPECETETPFTLPIEGGENLPGVDGPTFEAVSVVAGQQPIVPNPDDELTPEEIEAAAPTTPIVAYTIYFADFDLTLDDVTGLLGPRPDEGETMIFVSVVPPTADGLEVGDVVTQGRPEFESITTFGMLGAQLVTETVEDPPGFTLDSDGPGTAEVLFLDDERICLDISLGGGLFGSDVADATWSIDTVVSAELAPRGGLPFT